MGFYFFIACIVYVTLFWDMTPCNLLATDVSEDFLPGRELRYFGLLRDELCLFLSDVSGQPIGPILRVQVRKGINSNRCVITLKNAGLMYFAAKA